MHGNSTTSANEKSQENEGLTAAKDALDLRNLLKSTGQVARIPPIFCVMCNIFVVEPAGPC